MKKQLPLCGNLGEKVVHSPSGCRFKHTYVCDEFNIHVVPNEQCQKCSSYEAEYDLDKIKVEPNRFQQQLYATHTLPLGKGDGVVYVGGGKYWEGIAVGIRMLRDYSTLPVEVWYRGESEEIHSPDVEGMNVEFFDIDKIGLQLRDRYSFGGWEAKLYALAHTELDRVLFLDADAYVVENPIPLFKLLDHYTFVYWKDFEGQRGSIRWNQVLPGGEKWNLDPIQGGQFLVNRVNAQKLISLSNWLCENSDYYFRHMFGDQDTWRVALAGMLEIGEKVPLLKLGNARWQNVAFVCDYANKPYIVHRCQGKLFTHENIPVNRVKYSNPQYELPREVDVFNHLAAVVGEKKPEDVFKNIYAKRLWGGGSGAGTKLNESQLYIDTINTLAKKNNWKTAVDVGTGDGLVSSYLKFDFLKCYDCVTSIIDRNKKTYEGTFQVEGKKVERSYFTLDICKDYGTIDSGDVLLCKDIWQHWPTKMIVKFIDGLIESKKWKFILSCHDMRQYSDTQDCHLGGYRGLNYKMYPLNRYTWEYRCNIHHKDLLVMRLY